MKIDSLKVMYRTFQSCRHALNELSPEMQQALCTVIGQDIVMVSQLVAKDGFAIKIWG